jgi:hypothetical protein
MWTAETSAPSAPQSLDVASIPLFDGTSVLVTAKAKDDLEQFYGVTGGKVVNGEVQVWIEGRIVTGLGKILQRSASYVSLKDVVGLWIYDLRHLLDDDDQTFLLKDGDSRNLLPSNIGASPRRPEYL